MCLYAGKQGLMCHVRYPLRSAYRSRFLGGSLAGAAASWALTQRHCAHAEQQSQRPRFRALVVGSTGATGSKVVEKLASSDAWHVTAISRRPLNDVESSRLETVIVNDISEFQTDGTQKYDALFVCLGTTRGVAGSAEAFVDVEVGMTAKAIAAAKTAGVRHVGVVSAQGANPNAWVPSNAIHPMLYIRTLGQKELAVRAGGFQSVSIFRPGMLNRLRGDRLWENIVNNFGLGLRVDILAASIVADAEHQLLRQEEEDPLAFRCDVRIFEGNATIRDMVTACL